MNKLVFAILSLIMISCTVNKPAVKKQITLTVGDRYAYSHNWNACKPIIDTITIVTVTDKCIEIKRGNMTYWLNKSYFKKQIIKN